MLPRSSSNFIFIYDSGLCRIIFHLPLFNRPDFVFCFFFWSYQISNLWSSCIQLKDTYWLTFFNYTDILRLCFIWAVATLFPWLVLWVSFAVFFQAWFLFCFSCVFSSQYPPHSWSQLLFPIIKWIRLGGFPTHKVRVPRETSGILRVKEPGFHNCRSRQLPENMATDCISFISLHFFPAGLFVFFTCLTQAKAWEVSTFTHSFAHSCWGEVLLQTAMVHCFPGCDFG